MPGGSYRQPPHSDNVLPFRVPGSRHVTRHDDAAQHPLAAMRRWSSWLLFGADRHQRDDERCDADHQGESRHPQSQPRRALGDSAGQLAVHGLEERGIEHDGVNVGPALDREHLVRPVFHVLLEFRPSSYIHKLFLN